MPSYYPSAKVKLRVRFEELGRPTSLALPATPQTARRTGADPTPRALRYTPLSRESFGPSQGIASEQAVREGYLLEPMTTPESRATLAEGASSDDGLTWEIGSVLPLQCSVARNGIRAADTFKVVLPWTDFPFDPRLVRALGVEVYVGVVSAEDFDRGMSGDVRASTGEPYSVVPDSADDLGGRSNRRFVGFADAMMASHGDGPANVMLEGRDLTGLLIDAPLPSDVTADLTRPLSEEFAMVLATLPAAQGLTIRVLPEGTASPALSVAEAVPRHMRRRRGRELRRPAKGAQAKVSYWDYLTDLAGYAGFVCFVDGTDVIIQKPRSIYGSNFPTRTGDAYAGRLVDGEWLPVRRMVYGRNIARLEAERKYARIKVNTVEVRCYDPQQKRTLVGRFPTERRVSDAPPGQQGGDEKIDVFRVSGVRDEQQLRAMAQSVYEQQGRGEIGFSLETKDLHAYASEDEYASTFPDLLDLRAGDSVQIRVERQPDLESSPGYQDAVTQFEGLDATGRLSYLEALGFSRGLAQAYATLWEQAGHQDVFRVREVNIEFDHDSGVALKIALMNYIEVREEALLPAGEEPESPTAAAVGTAAPSDSTADPSRVRRQSVLDEDPDPLYPLSLEDDL